MPIKSKTAGKVSYIKNKEAMCLSRKQANYIYKKVEAGKVITVNTMKHEMEQDLDREDNNPYKRVILNKVYKDKGKCHRWKTGLYSVTMSGMHNMMKRLPTS